jgi:hypothetical protein
MPAHPAPAKGYVQLLQRRRFDPHPGIDLYTSPMPRDPAKAWRCSECGATWAQARRKQRREGGAPAAWPHLRLTCSRKCSRERELRRMRERHQPVRGRLPPAVRSRGEGWACSECGASWAVADRRRERLGLGPIKMNLLTCSPACSARRKRRYLAWVRR